MAALELLKQTVKELDLGVGVYSTVPALLVEHRLTHQQMQKCAECIPHIHLICDEPERDAIRRCRPLAQLLVLQFPRLSQTWVGLSPRVRLARRSEAASNPSLQEAQALARMVLGYVKIPLRDHLGDAEETDLLLRVAATQRQQDDDDRDVGNDRQRALSSWTEGHGPWTTGLPSEIWRVLSTYLQLEHWHVMTSVCRTWRTLAREFLVLRVVPSPLLKGSFVATKRNVMRVAFVGACSYCGGLVSTRLHGVTKLICCSCVRRLRFVAASRVEAETGITTDTIAEVSFSGLVSLNALSDLVQSKLREAEGLAVYQHDLALFRLIDNLRAANDKLARMVL